MIDLGDAQALANNHEFCWRVAGACVHVAGKVAGSADFSPPLVKLAHKAIWEWTDVGLVFARYLAHQGIAPDITDDGLIAAVTAAWPVIAGPSEEP